MFISVSQLSTVGYEIGGDFLICLQVSTFVNSAHKVLCADNQKMLCCQRCQYGNAGVVLMIKEGRK